MVVCKTVSEKIKNKVNFKIVFWKKYGLKPYYQRGTLSQWIPFFLVNFSVNGFWDYKYKMVWC